MKMEPSWHAHRDGPSRHREHIKAELIKQLSEVVFSPDNAGKIMCVEFEFEELPSRYCTGDMPHPDFIRLSTDLHLSWVEEKPYVMLGPEIGHGTPPASILRQSWNECKWRVKQKIRMAPGRIKRWWRSL